MAIYKSKPVNPTKTEKPKPKKKRHKTYTAILQYRNGTTWKAVKYSRESAQQYIDTLKKIQPELVVKSEIEVS